MPWRATSPARLALLTLAEPQDGVPVGVASVLVGSACAGFTEAVSCQLGLGRVR